LVKDFLAGVLSALVIYALLYRFLDRAKSEADEDATDSQSQSAREPVAEEGRGVRRSTPL
jgi:hypothetical protein